MYSTSATYKSIMSGLTKQDKVTGTLTYRSGTVLQITDDVIGNGSLSITSRCVENDSFDLGSVILSELEISLRITGLRSAFLGSTISLTYQLNIGNNTWESVPLGIFIITDVETIGDLIKITAYDYLQKLDVEFGSTTISGTPYQILSSICTTTGLTLGTSSSSIANLPNGTQTIQIDSESGCKSYREAVKIVCQMICAFAVADRNGNLVIKQFGNTKVADNYKANRYNLTLAEYNCIYESVSITGLSGTYFQGLREGFPWLTLYMNDAPAWDYGLSSTLNTRTENVYNYVKDIEYTPATIEMPGDPSYDCGDMINIYIDSEFANTIYAMQIEWRYHNTMTIECFGDDPYKNTANQVSNNTNRTQESITNKVTSVSSASTDSQYPSAKCVYDLVGNVESLLEALL